MSPPVRLPVEYRRRATRVVRIGSVAVGGAEPIRVQSMTTTDTGDVEATALQTLALAEAGCEIVRWTVPNMADAAALPALRTRLDQLGVKVPIVADIHFNPSAAMAAAEHCEKVRINPGNYADVKKFGIREYSDDEYRAEIDRIREKFAPLVDKCKRLGRAMRIGTNHGSLSDRIMNRHGDTALGMVESALEFVRLCEEQDYRDLVISMKSSNPFVAVQAYRLLAERMESEGMDYPFHLGVTEAGFGEDGRVKSAIGIGALLADGIGDTIRVSLTENPVHEVPVAFALASGWQAAAQSPSRDGERARNWVAGSAAEGARRPTMTVKLGSGLSIGGDARVLAIADLGPAEGATPLAARLREHVAAPGDDAALADIGLVEIASARELDVVEGARREAGSLPLALLMSSSMARDGASLERAARACDLLLLRPTERKPAEWRESVAIAARGAKAAGCGFGGFIDERAAIVDAPTATQLAQSASQFADDVIDATGALPLLAIVPESSTSPVAAVRAAAAALDELGFVAPLVLVDRSGALPGCEPMLEGAVRLGSLLVDGIGDALLVRDRPPVQSVQQALSILQTTRLRMTRPDYIACPSCGRTLFDLEEVTARIKASTFHLKGVKIAIMGCIVNGLGEMADADFGYVGSSPGKINLYVGKECIEKNVPSAEAERKLIELIKSRGRWVEPPVGATATG